MNGCGCSLVRIDGHRHAYVPGAVQVRVVQGGELGLAHNLRVLVAGPTGELHVQERQFLIVENLAILVDQCGELRPVRQRVRVGDGIVAALVPQHTGHRVALQCDDMAGVNIAALDMPVDRGAAPRGLDDADGNVRA